MVQPTPTPSALPDNEVLNITELKAAITAGDLHLASGATVPADSPLCPDFDSLDEWLALNTTQYVADGHRLDQLPVLGATEFINYVINVLGISHVLDNPNPYDTSHNDYFGRSVAMSGNFCIVGAYGEDDASGSGSGKAYIFDLSTGNLLHTLDNPNAYDTPTSDQFGSSVAISDSYCIVNAYGEDDAGGSASGKAYIFDNTNGNLLWTLHNPNADGSPLGDKFGNSVALSGNYAIIGEYLSDDTSSDSGKVHIFDMTTGGYKLTFHDIICPLSPFLALNSGTVNIPFHPYHIILVLLG